MFDKYAGLSIADNVVAEPFVNAGKAEAVLSDLIAGGQKPYLRGSTGTFYEMPLRLLQTNASKVYPSDGVTLCIDASSGCINSYGGAEALKPFHCQIASKTVPFSRPKTTPILHWCERREAEH